MARKKLAIFGATGTIGDNALSLVDMHPDLFDVCVLTANANSEKLIMLARRYRPEHVVIVDSAHYVTVRDALPDCNVSTGEDALADVAMSEYDIMLSAIMGFAALRPTLAAIRASRIIALANKECLVAAGALFMDECRVYKATLLPVDSEHNGLFQLWQAMQGQRPAHITLTASGGPFRNTDIAALSDVTVEQAVAHPNWSMGAKISVDSATMMNKGLELIEAQLLFDMSPNALRVLIHPQSIVHCLIGFDDGSQLAQLCLPDMRTPLAHALSYPERMSVDMPKLDLADCADLTFDRPDNARFPCLQLAYDAMHAGGDAPIVLNAANEVAVEAFLQRRIGFMDIAAFVERTMEHYISASVTSLDDVFMIDTETRIYTSSLL